MSEIENLNKMVGKTIESYKVIGTQLDLTFTDHTKVYDLLNNPKWVRFDENYMPIPDHKEVQEFYCPFCGMQSKFQLDKEETKLPLCPYCGNQVFLYKPK